MNKDEYKGEKHFNGNDFQTLRKRKIFYRNFLNFFFRLSNIEVCFGMIFKFFNIFIFNSDQQFKKKIAKTSVNKISSSV